MKFEDFYLNSERTSSKRDDVVFRCPSLTEQHHKSSCDINMIVKNMVKYTREEMVNQLKQVFSDANRFIDLSKLSFAEQGTGASVEAYMSMFNDFNENFVQTIPSAIREAFDNSSAKFYKFASDPKNQTALVKMFTDYSNQSVKNAEQLAATGHQPPKTEEKS